MISISAIFSTRNNVKTITRVGNKNDRVFDVLWAMGEKFDNNRKQRDYNIRGF